MNFINLANEHHRFTNLEQSRTQGLLNKKAMRLSANSSSGIDMNTMPFYETMVKNNEPSPIELMNQEMVQNMNIYKV